MDDSGTDHEDSQKSAPPQYQSSGPPLKAKSTSEKQKKQVKVFKKLIFNEAKKPVLKHR